jgi:hypothetical protein
MTTEIVHVEPNNLPSITPEQFDKSLVDAQAKAKSLKNMISSNDWAVDIRGSEHIRVEAWITLATGYNCTAKVVPGSVKQIEGYRCAWEARAEVLRDNGDGTTTVIGGAESECGTLGDGVWEKSQPSYAVKSMAQTRAISKAISSCFRWVVVLAGYSGTPYEEMPKDGGATFVESNDSPNNYSEPMATSAQQSFIKSLGYEGDVTQISKSGASEIIQELKLKKADNDLGREEKVMDMKELGEKIIDIQATPDTVNHALGLSIPPNGKLQQPIQDYIAEDPENRSCWVVARAIVDSMIDG